RQTIFCLSILTATRSGTACSGTAALKKSSPYWSEFTGRKEGVCMPRWVYPAVLLLALTFALHRQATATPHTRQSLSRFPKAETEILVCFTVRAFNTKTMRQRQVAMTER